MKKSLVAIAALTLVGAASAQVSLTGTISFAHQNSYASSTSGTGMSDNSIFLSGSEDIGGGTTVSFSTGFDAGGRAGSAVPGANYGGEDANLSIGGGFGKVILTSYESHSPIDDNVLISGTAQNSAVHDTAALGIKLSDRTGIIYVTPSFSGLTGKVALIRNNDYSGSKYVVGGTYVAGGLKVYLESDSFDNSNYANGTVVNSDGTATVVKAAGATAYVAYAVYDAGFAKFAVGVNKNSYDPNGTTAWGVSVPVGALSFGIDGASYNGASLVETGVNYSLSKRTTLKAGYGYINDNAKAMSGTFAAGGNAVGTVLAAPAATAWNNNAQYRVGLFHSF